MYRGNKITIYSLKLRELSTLILTRYTYFLLSVSRQGANNTPQRKFNCTQYNCRKHQLKIFQHKLILSTFRIFIFLFTTRIAQAATLQIFRPSQRNVTSRHIISLSQIIRHFLSYVYFRSLITLSSRRFRLRRALHQEQQDCRWSLVQFRQPSVAGEVLLAQFPPPRRYSTTINISRTALAERHTLPFLCIIHRKQAINLRV